MKCKFKGTLKGSGYRGSEVQDLFTHPNTMAQLRLIAATKKLANDNIISKVRADSFASPGQMSAKYDGAVAPHFSNQKLATFW